MVRKLQPDMCYRIRDPGNFHAAMRADVELLRSHRAYVSLTTLIVCCLDALAAGSEGASRGKFEDFVTQHFPDLCQALEAARPGRTGAATLYDGFRNGFAHLRGPKSEFAIAEDHEVGSDWADRVGIDGVGQFVALNVDRLTREFLNLLGRIQQDATPRCTRRPRRCR